MNRHFFYASPLRRNRDASTAQSRCRCATIAVPLRWNGKGTAMKPPVAIGKALQLDQH